MRARHKKHDKYHTKKSEELPFEKETIETERDRERG